MICFSYSCLYQNGSLWISWCVWWQAKFIWNVLTDVYLLGNQKMKPKTIRKALWWTLRDFSTLSCDSRSMDAHLWALFLCRWFGLCNVRHKWDSANVPASSCTVFFLNSAFPKCYQASVLCIPAHLHCNYFKVFSSNVNLYLQHDYLEKNRNI